MLSKLKQEHNLRIYLIEMGFATVQDIAKHVIRLAKVIPANHI